MPGDEDPRSYDLPFCSNLSVQIILVSDSTKYLRQFKKIFVSSFGGPDPSTSMISWCYCYIHLLNMAFLAALAPLYIPLLNHSVSDCHFRIWTQRVTLETRDPSSSAHKQFIISTLSAHDQLMISSSSAHRQFIISSSLAHQHSAAHHQLIASSPSAHHQLIISSSSAHH